MQLNGHGMNEPLILTCRTSQALESQVPSLRQKPVNMAGFFLCPVGWTREKLSDLPPHIHAKQGGWGHLYCWLLCADTQGWLKTWTVIASDWMRSLFGWPFFMRLLWFFSWQYPQLVFCLILHNLSENVIWLNKDTCVHFSDLVRFTSIHTIHIHSNKAAELPFNLMFCHSTGLGQGGKWRFVSRSRMTFYTVIPFYAMPCDPMSSSAVTWTDELLNMLFTSRLCNFVLLAS